MGKQNRKKQRQQRGGGKGGGGGGLTTNAAASTTSTTGAATAIASASASASASPFANVVKRIRHVDPKIRLATLLGLQSTLAMDLNARFDEVAERATSSTPPPIRPTLPRKQVSLEILQAVREQVLDQHAQHLECATAATECLVQYLKLNQLDEEEREQLQAQLQAQLIPVPSSNNNKTMATTASWSLIFLGRLQQCHYELRQILSISPAQEPNDALPTLPLPLPVFSKAQIKELKQWYALAVPCLQAVCHLIETNPIALNHILTSCQTTSKAGALTTTTTTHGVSFLPVLLGLMEDVMLHQWRLQQQHNQQQQDQHASSAVVVSMTDEDITATPATAQAKRKKRKKKKADSEEDEGITTDWTLMQQTAIYACRVLHSSLDQEENSKHKKNKQLAENLQQQLAEQMTSAATTVASSSSSVIPKLHWSTAVSSSSRLLPTVAQLHLAGCLVTAMSNSGTAMEYWTEQVLYHAIPSLLHHFQVQQEQLVAVAVAVREPHTTNPVAPALLQIFQSYHHGKRAVQQEKEDDSMEQDIVRTIDARREPAREIARRHKQQGRPKSTATTTKPTTTAAAVAASGTTAEDMDDKEMMDAGPEGDNDDDDDDDLEDGIAMGADDESPKVKNGAQVMEDAQLEWNAILDPLELCLEVTTNLLDSLIARGGGGNDDDDDDEDEPMDDDDDDDEDGPSAQPFREPIQQSLIKAQLFPRVFQLLQQVGESKSTLLQWKADEASKNEEMIKKDDVDVDISEAANNKGEVDSSDPLIHDLDNILSKISGCLVNCFLSECVIPLSQGGQVDEKLVWQGLKQHVHEDGVSSIMVVAVQHHASFRELINISEIDFLLHQLGATATAAHTVREAKLQRDIVCLLSAVIPTLNEKSHGHVKHSNSNNNTAVTKITTSFLGVLERATAATSTALSAVTVACEVLNAIMDIFAEDDLYNDIFQNLDVLMKVEKSIARLRQKQSQKLLGQWEEGVVLMEPEEQEEIIYNSQRFVEYKQQQ